MMSNGEFSAMNGDVRRTHSFFALRNSEFRTR